MNRSETLREIMIERRSTRSFTGETIDQAVLEDVLKSVFYAPYAAASTGLALRDVRKVYAFRIGSSSMESARDILLETVAANAGKLNTMLRILPFFRPRMGLFARRLNMIVSNGIPSLHKGSFYIVVAEKKGFPSVAGHSLSYAMQNMWLAATAHGIGFQLISATSLLSKSRPFLRLLQLPYGYQLDGCVIGVPEAAHAEARDGVADGCTVFMK